LAAWNPTVGICSAALILALTIPFSLIPPRLRALADG